jgi:hypothetical protein
MESLPARPGISSLWRNSAKLLIAAKPPLPRIDGDSSTQDLMESEIYTEDKRLEDQRTQEDV